MCNTEPNANSELNKEKSLLTSEKIRRLGVTRAPRRSWERRRRVRGVPSSPRQDQRGKGAGGSGETCLDRDLGGPPPRRLGERGRARGAAWEAGCGRTDRGGVTLGGRAKTTGSSASGVSSSTSSRRALHTFLATAASAAICAIARGAGQPGTAGSGPRALT